MAIQLRASIPDRPGALARVGRVIAQSGGDIVSVSVLGTEGGRVVDDFRLSWPDGRDVSQLLANLARCDGVAVLGCRWTPWLRNGRPDLDLLAAMLTGPGRGVETLVDMAPAAFDTDWAELRAPARGLPRLYGTTVEARDDAAPDVMPIRGTAGNHDDFAWAWLPIPVINCVLVLGRDGGPAFLRTEVVDAERFITLAISVLSAALRNWPVHLAPTDLTGHIARAR